MEVSEKESRAILLNFKELRCLEKKSVMLDVEKAYNVSLINLDQKVVQVAYKQFTERVGRIHSHLSLDDIQLLKCMDQEGRLGLPATTTKLDSNMRIKAAAKRLKLLPRSKSAVPRLGTNTSRPAFNDLALSHQPVTPRTDSRASSVKPRIKISKEPEFVSHLTPPQSLREARRKSIDFTSLSDINSSGSPMLLISPRKVHTSNTCRASGKSPNSANSSNNRSNNCGNVSLNLQFDSNGIRDPNRLSPLTNNFVGDPNKPIEHITMPENSSNDPVQINRQSPSPRQSDSSPSNALAINGKSCEQSRRSKRVSLAASIDTEFQNTDTKRKMPLRTTSAIGLRKKSIISINNASKLLSEGKTRSPFCSHDMSEKDTKKKCMKPFRSIRDGKLAGIEHGKLDSLGGDLYKQMKQGLILSEAANSLYLEDKIDSFLERMEEYVSEVKNAERQQIERLKETIEMINRKLKGEKIRKPKRNASQRDKWMKRLYGDQDRKPNEDDWKDVNKCRYLRVPDEMIDLSGVQTLVAEQMKVANKIKFGAEYDEDSDED